MTPEQLGQFAESALVQIETSRDGRTVKTIIWVVVVAGEVYVRSVRGDDGKWYQRAVDNPAVALLIEDMRVEFEASSAADPESVSSVSAAIADKYSGKSVDAMNQPDVLHTTLRLEPVG